MGGSGVISFPNHPSPRAAPVPTATATAATGNPAGGAVVGAELGGGGGEGSGGLEANGVRNRGGDDDGGGGRRGSPPRPIQSQQHLPQGSKAKLDYGAGGGAGGRAGVGVQGRGTASDNQASGGDPASPPRRLQEPSLKGPRKSGGSGSGGKRREGYPPERASVGLGRPSPGRCDTVRFVRCGTVEFRLELGMRRYTCPVSLNPM